MNAFYSESSSSDLVESGRENTLPCSDPELWESMWVPGAAILGVAVGLFAPPDSDAIWEYASSVLGWTYFCMWSVSFYPQVVQNAYRRSVKGLSVDFQLLNFVGFACYFAFNAALYWSVDVQVEYAAAHAGHASAVRLNDVVFAGHAALLTLVTLVQIAVYHDNPPLQGVDQLIRCGIVTALSVVVAVFLGIALLIHSTSERDMDWLSYLVALSYVKVAISVTKYIPQVWMNCRRQSTDGWNIHNVLLDFWGGLLSVLQLFLDAHMRNDWSAVTGDPAKLLLGNISMGFDIVFMIQHYYLYSDRGFARSPNHKVAQSMHKQPLE
eukprot:TRINITY_DN14265_c0_g6_i1.p1 TRINITY_DN14265_c0_g6~~TRINITY_DN14265_c0_g6_i1.p1  ORF type:complete len:324 (+),score=23.16 TRINITY_DN14265_c0_g6_i1:135-1106(+)